MEVKHSRRFNIPFDISRVVLNKPKIALLQNLYKEIQDFRLKNYRNPDLIKISYEEEYQLRNEQTTHSGPLSYYSSLMLLFGIPLVICEKPEPRFE